MLTGDIKILYMPYFIQSKVASGVRHYVSIPTGRKECCKLHSETPSTVKCILISETLMCGKKKDILKAIKYSSMSYNIQLTNI